MSRTLPSHASAQAAADRKNSLRTQDTQARTTGHQPIAAGPSSLSPNSVSLQTPLSLRLGILHTYDQPRSPHDTTRPRYRRARSTHARRLRLLRASPFLAPLSSRCCCSPARHLSLRPRVLIGRLHLLPLRARGHEAISSAVRAGLRARRLWVGRAVRVRAGAVAKTSRSASVSVRTFADFGPLMRLALTCRLARPLRCQLCST